ncbi:hypothetical protein F4604DRAFT_1684479 [Suillus subluteus]|nr:hypothetical protein F4604DRAFT_1684479 [Suillus subluteus]
MSIMQPSKAVSHCISPKALTWSSPIPFQRPTSTMVFAKPQILLTPDLQAAPIETAKNQLQTLADKHTQHAESSEDDREELALLEEVEEFAARGHGEDVGWIIILAT